MRNLFHWGWLLVLLLAGGLPAHATHLVGGDITYTALPAQAGVPRYHVTVRLFVNAAPLSFDQPSIVLAASAGTCGSSNASNFSLIIPRNQIISSADVNCASTSSYSYKINLYEADISLAPNQWTLSVITENRRADILNINTNSISLTCYLSTTLNNTLAATNSSPTFLSSLLPFVTGNTTQHYSFSAFDADGDSLRYEFTTPQQALGGGSLFQCGIAIGSIISPHFTINPATGDLTRSPGNAQQGLYVMAARVYEYRRLGGQWQLLGYVTRDINYLVYAGTNQPPTFTSLTVNGVAHALDQPVAAPAGQTLQLVLTAADPDAGQLLRFVSEAPGVVPGLSATTLNNSQVSLTWQVPATLPLGRYAIPVAVLDNGCLYNASEARTLAFVVGSRLLATKAAQLTSAEAYPMPFYEQVQFTAAPNQAVVVADVLGREVARLQAAADGRVQWQPAASLPAGLYLARTTDGRVLARLLRADN